MGVRPAAQHRAARRRRNPGRRRRVFRALCGVLLTPLAVALALYLAGGGFLHLRAASGGAGRPIPAAAASPAAQLAISPTPSPLATPSRADAHAHAARKPRATTSQSQNGSATAAAAGQGLTAAAQVLALINQARGQAGLAPYTLLSGLDSSAAAHNARMADGCGLSHQCPGEAPLGTRETDAGVSWTAAGENIGEGGPVADTTSAIAQMAVSLSQSMLNEGPPDDGHRLNILSSSFRFIGIAVSVDNSGNVWMTQDFAS